MWIFGEKKHTWFFTHCFTSLFSSKKISENTTLENLGMEGEFALKLSGVPLLWEGQRCHMEI